MPDAMLITRVLRPVNFAHAGVNGGQHARCAGFTICALRHGGEGGDADHRQFCAQRQPLRNTDADTDAGKTSRSAAKCQRVEIAQRHVVFVQDLLNQRQNALRMLSRAEFKMGMGGVVMQQRN